MEVGLAEALSAVAEKHLNIDVLDDTQGVSRFISYLLDTIQMLEGQVNYHKAGSNSSDSESDSEDDVVEQPPSLRTLHRIFCTNNSHSHHRAIYEDEPTYHNLLNNSTAGLSAKTRVLHIGAYLNRHPNVCTIIFKEHNCEMKPSSRSTSTRIVSPLLEKALSYIAEFPVYKSGMGDVADAPKEMDAPYPFFFHHRKKLAELAQHKMYAAVVEPLLKFINENYEAEYDEAEKLFQEGKITAHHIGKLFKPNQMVISRKDGNHLEAYVLKDYIYPKREKVEMYGWAWQYNGADLHRRDWEGKMATVEEEKPISDLTIHPVAYARSEDIEKLEARGKKFWDMRGQTLRCYTGWDKAHDHFYNNARFMVDVATYQLIHRSSPVVDLERNESAKYDRWPMKISRHQELPPKAELLLPTTIHGFNLHDKKWVILEVEKFHPVDWNKKAFDRLVLDPKTKEMIYALINVQTSTKKMDDIITGKGNGLIILLHGSPGTGKTLTAESVAEIAEKPLYRVTCGDIGTEAEDVERYLETVLYLGKTWDSVLLLDEADVFLEERTMADLQRNSLVSVFLRVLEYYEGILILTSNRVGTFDEAFKSRIQVAIHYDNLTKKSRKAIWRNFFDMIEESTDEDANMAELERRLDDLAAEEMNGRQIRNALLTARQLAKHRKERLDWEHLSQVIKTSGAFNKYLKTVRGHSDDQWAREEMLR
ncbi:P-loop containing nucleoside triphosphate hydrolase protein [Thozetella sp. PMI_491]|nr:P-loop containing nucleoside triphosphate hydrolase protein [Thozetella sp. PMI_491]